MHKLYYQPPGAYFGDCMPFGKDGTFYLYHQRDFRNPGPLPICEPFGWDLVTTRDFIHYEEHETAIPTGESTAQDQFIFAGSIFEDNKGLYHAFYTGYNRDYPSLGKPSQVLMHATSNNLFHWTKSSESLSFSPQPGYDPTDWRDPFVIWDAQKQQYVLILGARLESDKHHLTGRTVYFTSKDLNDWDFQGDFWAPNLFTMHEMPDLFRIGDWWYLITTEYSNRCKTVYRMSQNLYGPWLTPDDDAFDGRAYYAGRTFEQNGHRILFGWVPTRETEDDKSNFVWGGTYVPHEIFQKEDGTLGIKIPDTVWEAFSERKNIESVAISGSEQKTTLTLYNRTSSLFSLECDIQFSKDTKNFHLQIYENSLDGRNYQFTFLPKENRFVFEKCPNWPWPTINNMGLERPLTLLPDTPYHLRLIVDDTIATIYVNGTALNTRMCEKPGEALSFSVYGGTIKLKNISFSNVLNP